SRDSYNDRNETWYWQGTNPEGTSTENDQRELIVSTSGTYYLRTLGSNGCWGQSTSVYIDVNPYPLAPEVLSIEYNAICNSATLTRSEIPVGEIWYWTGSELPNSGSNSDQTITVYERGTYRLRAESDQGCVTYSEPIEVEFDTPSGNARILNSGVEHSPHYGCEEVILRRSNPPSGETWYWQGTNPDGTSTAFSDEEYRVTETGWYYLRILNDQGCWSERSAKSYVDIQTPPFDFELTGGGTGCVESINELDWPEIGLVNSELNVRYRLYRDGQQTQQYIEGTGSAISFGRQDRNGVYSVRASNMLTSGCYIDLSDTKEILYDKIPSVFKVSKGEGLSCSTFQDGTRIINSFVEISDTEVGVSYQLFKDGEAVLSPREGTGSSVGFSVGGPGEYVTYTVVATSDLLGCSIPMPGSALVEFEEVVLVNRYTLEHTGNTDSPTCEGELVEITLSDSELNARYWLERDGNYVELYTGTGGPLNFGKFSEPGTYIIKGKYFDHPCNRSMIGSLTIEANPQAFDITSDAQLISEGEDMDVTLVNSEQDVSYQLLLNGEDAGVPLNGTGNSLAFRNNTQEGTYAIEATKSNGCSMMMNNTVYLKVIENSNLNYIRIDNYTNDVTPIAKSIQYFDNAGKSLQSQTWNAEENDVLVNEPLYDDYDRAVGQTLNAPIGRSSLGYKAGFATVNGNQLTEANWTGTAPSPIDHTSPNTLGHYYTNAKGISSTSLPYSVSNYYEDGSGESKSASLPGDYHFLKSGNNVIQKNLPVFNGELRFYNEIRQLLVGSTGNLDQVIKSVAIDGNDNQSIVYQNDQGMGIASANGKGGASFSVSKTVVPGRSIEFHRSISTGDNRTYYDLINEVEIGSGGKPAGLYRYANLSSVDINFGTQLTYSSFTYNFYDNKGRLIASMTPKGTQMIFDQGGLGSIDLPEELPYTTLYRYDFQGRLISMTEPDAGITNYVYRKDGQIKFSQNNEQAEDATLSRFSVTSYDRLGRPIMSGEYTVPFSESGVRNFD
ncbi:MAG: hypothetical protein AAFY41_03775, partial [Bacteroidota bacterium]